MKKKKNYIKKQVKRNNKSENSKVDNQGNEVDLWKEIRSNLKPLVKAYNKFSDKRRITKQKEEERRLKEDEKQRLREEEALRLQKQEERRIKRQKKIEEEKERRLRAQEKLRLEEKRTKDEREGKIRQEQNYRERLLKGEEERIKQLKRVNELREEERKLIEERSSKIDDSFVDQQRLKEKVQRLKEEEQRLKTEEQRLKAEEQRLKEEKINLKEVEELDDGQEKKRLNGTVKWFNVSKGYGFIKREDKEKDIFVHFSAVKNSGLKFLKEGEQLMFEVEDSDKGPSAVNLQNTVNEVSHSHLKVVK